MRFDGPPSRVKLEKIFFLDNADKALIGRRCGAHMKLGLECSSSTVRYLGMFLADPLDVPNEVVDVVTPAAPALLRVRRRVSGRSRRGRRARAAEDRTR